MFFLFYFILYDFFFVLLKLIISAYHSFKSTYLMHFKIILIFFDYLNKKTKINNFFYFNITVNLNKNVLRIRNQSNF